MPQYTSSSSTPGGLVVTAVYDTTTNLITYTAAATNGTVATTSAASTTPGNSVSIVNALRTTLRNGGVPSAEFAGIGDALNNVYQDVTDQAARATAASTATETPPPQNPDPPPPQSNTTDPGIPNPPEAEEPPPEPGPEQLTGSGYTIPPEDPDAGPELLTPPDPDEPEELNGYGYNVPEENEEDGPTLLTPPDPDEPEELNGYGYEVTDNPLLDPNPEYNEPPDLPEELNGTGYNIPSEEEGAILLTPPGAGGGGGGGSRGLFGSRAEARGSANIQDQYRTNSLKDWRVSLSLAPKAEYLYRSKNPGILAPLAATDGVVFPYTPSVQVTYAANYEPTTPTHSNYKIFQYTSSAVDQVSISCDFTAQDTFEANYLLAVIHFFRSITKMFYGQDQDPRAGTPPPLVFLNGYGAFQYNQHPLIISNFNYSLPTDVDYIRSYLTPAAKAEAASGGSGRLGTTILPGGLVPKTVFGLSTKNENPTYVPTRMNIQISAYPVVTRNKISNEFSLEKYGSGELISKGIW